MQFTALQLALGGNQTYAKFTISYTDINGVAATSTALTLTGVGGGTFSIPQGGKVTGVCVRHTTAFAGPAITAMTISIGQPSGSATFYTPAFDIFQAVADNTLQETVLFKSGQITAHGLTATFTATGANLSVLTAGSVDVYVLYLAVSTPGA